MRWSTQLPLLLHVHRLISLLSCVYIRLCINTFGAAADRNERLSRRDKAFALQCHRVGDLLPLGVVGDWTRWLSYVSYVVRSDDQRGHQGLILNEDRTSIGESVFAREYLRELFLYPLWSTAAIADR